MPHFLHGFSCFAFMVVCNDTQNSKGRFILFMVCLEPFVNLQKVETCFFQEFKNVRIYKYENKNNTNSNHKVCNSKSQIKIHMN